MEPSLTRPSLGRRVALELRHAQPVTWVGPAWATLCGAVASGAFTLSGATILRIAIAILLADPILGAWRAAWVNTDWRAPLRIWRATPTRSWMLLPYARLDSPAARLSQWISSRVKFWDSALWPQIGRALSALLVSGLIALTVALVLGSTSFLITLFALVLAPLEAELGADGVGRWPRALAEIGIPWLLGQAALVGGSWESLLRAPAQTVSHAPWESILLALFFAAMYRGLLSLVSWREFGFALSNVAQILVSLVLAARGALVNAGLVGLALVGQALWQALARRLNASDAEYLPRVQWFILAAMFVAALGMPH